MCSGDIFVATATALLAGVQARLAASQSQLTIMIALFGVLANGRTLFAEPNHYDWTECALNLALVVAAWVVANRCRGSDPLRKEMPHAARMTNVAFRDERSHASLNSVLVLLALHGN